MFGATPGGFGTAGAATAAPAFGTTTGTAFGATAAQPQSIGLFGAQNQAKPLGFGATPTTGFGAAQPATSNSFGFGATNTFGAANPAQQKPAAFGFGATNTATPGFGGFGTAQPQQNTGGLFGAAKPAGAFGSFGATSQAPTFGTPTSSFGTSTFGQPNTSGSIFNANTQNKPFGTTFGTSGGFGTGLGATTGAAGSFGFGTPNSSFNLNNPSSSFGAGGLTGGLNQQPQQPQQLPSIQSQLASLTSNPYGDNPLFKTLLPDNNRREEIMKPTNPAAQKAALLASSNQPQYKVSPRGGLKAKVKPLSGNKNNSSNKSAFFDGLDEDDSIDAKSDLFVPRSSVKKLILKPKNALTLDDSSLNESNINIEDSLTLPSVKKLPLKTGAAAAANANLDQPGDDSLSNLYTKKKELATANEDSTVILDQSVDVEVESELPQPAGIKLRRAGYYTIPNMSELATMVDQEGNLNVENFTIGKKTTIAKLIFNVFFLIFLTASVSQEGSLRIAGQII